MADRPISGTLAAAVTPLRDGGTRLDEDAFTPLLEFYRASGLDGLLARLPGAEHTVQRA
jgi:dihydrodipicolinate synthase/N-acetylneuraminate lyase